MSFDKNSPDDFMSRSVALTEIKKSVTEICHRILDSIHDLQKNNSPQQAKLVYDAGNALIDTAIEEYDFLAMKNFDPASGRTYALNGAIGVTHFISEEVMRALPFYFLPTVAGPTAQQVASDRMRCIQNISLGFEAAGERIVNYSQTVDRGANIPRPTLADLVKAAITAPGLVFK